MARAQRPFTDAFLKNLKVPAGERVEHWDAGCPGLGVRVSGPRRNAKAGACILRWILNARDPQTGKARRVVLGAYPALTLSEARMKANELQHRRRAGIDPAAALQAERAATLAAHEEATREPTVADFAKVYMARHAEKKASGDEDRRKLEVEVIPKLGRLKMRDVRRRHLIDLLDDVTDRGAPIAANRLAALLSKFFNHAVDRDIIDASPAQRLPKNDETPKDRALADDEIRLFWEGIEQTRASEASKAALKLILVLGQRPGEVLGMSESELQDDVWTIPWQRHKVGKKSKRDHAIPLPPLALELIGRARAAAHGSEFLFPSPRDRKKPLNEKVLSHVLARNTPRPDRKTPPAIDIAARFTPHDLRRTARSKLAELGVGDVVADRVTNHVMPGMRAVYNQYSYMSEKRHALELWERRLRVLVGLPPLEGKVVQLPARGGAA